jgi:hypothetical protein
VGTTSTAHEGGALEQTVEWFGLGKGVYKSTVVDREKEVYLRSPRDGKVGRSQVVDKGNSGCPGQRQHGGELDSELEKGIRLQRGVV